MAYDKENMKSKEDNVELANLIDSHINDSLGFIETETSQDRQTALEYYLREPYGNEVEGRSQIVTGEVAEVVDGALPQIMKVFTSSNKAVEFEPVNEGDGALAEQMTAYANHIFYKDNNGFEIMHDWFKAQRSLVTRSDLIAMGYDPKVVETLPMGDTLDFTPERVARYGAGEQPFNTNDSNDESMELVEYY